jgi:hypothetical protein
MARSQRMDRFFRFTTRSESLAGEDLDRSSGEIIVATQLNFAGDGSPMRSATPSGCWKPRNAHHSQTGRPSGPEGKTTVPAREEELFSFAAPEYLVRLFTQPRR